MLCFFSLLFRFLYTLCKILPFFCKSWFFFCRLSESQIFNSVSFSITDCYLSSSKCPHSVQWLWSLPLIYLTVSPSHVYVYSPFCLSNQTHHVPVVIHPVSICVPSPLILLFQLHLNQLWFPLFLSDCVLLQVMQLWPWEESVFITDRDLSKCKWWHVVGALCTQWAVSLGANQTDQAPGLPQGKWWRWCHSDLRSSLCETLTTPAVRHSQWATLGRFNDDNGWFSSSGTVISAVSFISPPLYQNNHFFATLNASVTFSAGFCQPSVFEVRSCWKTLSLSQLEVI